MKTIKKAQWIKVDGTITIVSPKNGRNFKLIELQNYVDGLIEMVYFPNNSKYIMVVNEEGRFTKQYNTIASQLCTMAFGKVCTIHGDVLICENNMVK